ncbi:hypothetical protein BH23ACT9_BH23ACT9_17120 [soil metagenome]
MSSRRTPAATSVAGCPAVTQGPPADEGHPDHERFADPMRTRSWSDGSTRRGPSCWGRPMSRSTGGRVTRRTASWARPGRRRWLPPWTGIRRATAVLPHGVLRRGPRSGGPPGGGLHPDSVGLGGYAPRDDRRALQREDRSTGSLRRRAWAGGPRGARGRCWARRGGLPSCVVGPRSGHAYRPGPRRTAPDREPARRRRRGAAPRAAPEPGTRSAGLQATARQRVVGERHAAVTTPSVPSDPTSRHVRSGPATPLVVLRPVSMRVPSARTTSSPRT